MTTKKHNRQSLTRAEQKTTVAFKLLTEQNYTLKQSLKKTQNELEIYREKYHESDKKHAIEKSKNSTLIFHEILKFVVSILCGGIGVNLITTGFLKEGIGAVIIGIVLYTVIVLTDKSKK